MIKDRERKAAYDRAYRLKDREHRDAVYAAWYAKNRERRSAYNKAYNQRSLKQRAALQKAWRLKNPERYSEIQKASYVKKRQRYDYRILRNLRGRLIRVLKGLSKSNSTLKLLGCGLEDLRLHIESLWEPGMSWENYGQWHVDHMIPCALFDFSKPEHQRRCFHFSNLRPMWAISNMSKGKKLITNQYNLL